MYEIIILTSRETTTLQITVKLPYPKSKINKYENILAKKEKKTSNIQKQTTKANNEIKITPINKNKRKLTFVPTVIFAVDVVLFLAILTFVAVFSRREFDAVLKDNKILMLKELFPKI